VPAPLPTVRPWEPEGADTIAVSRLVGAYLRQTEREKAAHLRGESLPLDAKLPTRYRQEAEDPATPYAEATVLLAELEGSAVGLLVLHPGDEAITVKRLWTTPDARGQGVGAALVDAAIAAAPGLIRLAVWDWRGDALRLYAARGFERVASWDDRPRIVCMERTA
jgi:GNAT superfamily N-acetyltransferase